MSNNITDSLNTLIGTGALREEMRKMLQDEIQNLLHDELSSFLGYEKGDVSGWGSGNNRNGKYPRKISTMYGDLELEIPRDRNGAFTQHTVPRYSRQTEDLTEIILELYAKGLTDRDLTSTMEQLYGKYYSPATISNITKSFNERARLFHNRSFTDYYPFIFMDATYLNLRRDSVGKEALHVILGITPDGHKEILDFALFPTESAANYESMLQGLKERGLNGVLLGISDGLTGMEDMIRRVFEKAEHQSCWVHIQRNIMRLVRERDRARIASELKAVYTASNIEDATKLLEDLCERNQKMYPKLGVFFSGKTNLFNFYHYPKAIWRTIYTTNIIESNNKSLKRKTKAKEQFPNEDALNRFVAVRYSIYNDKMSSFTHYGFKTAEYDLREMISLKYPGSEVEDGLS